MAALLAACGSSSAPTARPQTVAPTPTAAPTATPTLAPTPTPTPTATPVATPQPILSVFVTVTCSNVLNQGQFAKTGYPKGSILGIATWHNLTLGDYFGIGLNTVLVTSPTMTIGVVGFGNAFNAFTQGKWNWAEFSGQGQSVKVASGTLTIPACPGKTIK